MVNRKALKKLRVMCYRERAGTECVMHLDSHDSLALADAFYNRGIGLYYEQSIYDDVKGLSFAEFIAELKDGYFGELRFKGLRISWFQPATLIWKPTLAQLVNS